jgi:hypothetical protein
VEKHNHQNHKTPKPIKPPKPKQEKSDVDPSLPPALAAARADLEALVVALAEAQAARSLPVALDEYLRTVLHPGLMEARGGGVRGGDLPCWSAFWG